MNKISIILLLAFSPISFAIDTGASMPACTLTDISKNSDVSMPTSGKVVYVDFWASWCGPCGESFPFMNKLHHDLEAKGLQVIAINLDENVDDARLFLKNKTAEFKIASDINAQCAQKFDVQAMPSTYLIDRKGIVRQIHFGFRTGEAEEFRRKVQALLEE